MQVGKLVGEVWSEPSWKEMKVLPEINGHSDRRMAVGIKKVYKDGDKIYLIVVLRDEK